MEVTFGIGGKVEGGGRSFFLGVSLFFQEERLSCSSV